MGTINFQLCKNSQWLVPELAQTLSNVPTWRKHAPKHQAIEAVIKATVSVLPPSGPVHDQFIQSFVALCAIPGYYVREEDYSVLISVIMDFFMREHRLGFQRL